MKKKKTFKAMYVAKKSKNGKKEELGCVASYPSYLFCVRVIGSPRDC